MGPTLHYRLTALGGLTTRFACADDAVIAEILQTLVTLGRARPGDAKGTFVR